MQMQWTFSRSASCEWKGTLNEGSVMPPLTDSHNDICSVCFCWLPLIKHNEGSTACFYDCCLFTALRGQRLTMCACKHYVLSHTQTHTHGCMGKQQWCRRECSCSMSGEATYWHDPLNNRCTRTHTQWNTHITIWLTEAKTLPNVHTCAIPECAPIMAPTYANNLWQRKAKETRSVFFSAYLLKLLPGTGALIYCWLH